MVDWSFFIGALIALLTITNPISTAGVFVSITRKDSKEKKKLMAKRASVTSALILIVFAIIGNYILNLFGITLDAFRIAGGLLVMVVGFNMLRSNKENLPSEKEKSHAIKKEDISIVPLAIPMISGPGAIATALVLASQTSGLINFFMLLVAIILVSLTAFIVLIYSDRTERFLGETGRRVIDRIMGLIVMVVGVQFIINGVLGVIAGL